MKIDPFPRDPLRYSAMRITLATGITLARLALLPFTLYLLYRGDREAAFALLLLILLGDLVDGALARWRREVTAIGKALDPVVDKLVFLGVFAALTARGELSPWALGLLAGIQLTILIGGIVWLRQGWEPPVARPLGKTASFVLSMGLIAAFVQLPLAQWLVYAGIALGYLAGLDYLRVLLRSLKEGTPLTAPPSVRSSSPAGVPTGREDPHKRRIPAGEEP